jgi:hypothetical protein
MGLDKNMIREEEEKRYMLNKKNKQIEEGGLGLERRNKRKYG